MSYSFKNMFRLKMKSVIILVLFVFAAMSFTGCMSDQEAVKSYLDKGRIYGALKPAKRMVDSGADVNAKLGIRNYTFLHIAAENDDIEFAKLLIAKGADVNVKMDNGNTPLYMATYEGDTEPIEMVELLLKHGADPNSNSKLGTPLLNACKYSYYEVVKVLVDHGADVNLPNEALDTPLLYSNDIRIIKYLISKGADVNAKNKIGATILFPIIRKWYMDKAKKKELLLFLISKGVDINAVQRAGIFNNHFSTALDEAIVCKNPEDIILMLRKQGAKTVDELRKEGKLPPAPSDDED